ncbi:hypothetical protein CDAR_274291 [Caerostris darwini]|uniref:Uncharacterized protein n=1 Tax=Caerostris darwini TaxID=1538125 RepID=A0AAV4RGR3_9ARAC|nr:hypothetical protein CDAR_274291 [Caerostris darwini]
MSGDSRLIGKKAPKKKKPPSAWIEVATRWALQISYLTLTERLAMMSLDEIEEAPNKIDAGVHCSGESIKRSLTWP